MSIYKEDRKKGDLDAITKATDMVAHTLKITDNTNVFPKRHRFSITQKIQNKAIDVLTLTIEANEIFPTNAKELMERQLKQKQAAGACRSLLAIVNIANATFNIPNEKLRYWVSMIVGTRNNIISWQKSDAKRFEKLLS